MTDNRVVALYSVFNSQALIRNAMTSTLPLADEYLVYDGKYSGFKCPCKADHNFSCDNTLKEVERFESETGVKVTIKQTGDMPEFDKRNMMFDAVPDGDLCLIADDDEIFYGRLENVKSFEGDQANIVCLRLRHSFDPLPRVFRKRPGLRYVQVVKGAYSYEFSDANGRLKDFETIPQVRMVNLYGTWDIVGYRERDRDAARSAYNELGINQKLPQGVTTNP